MKDLILTIDLRPDGPIYDSFTIEQLIEIGVSDEHILEAVKNVSITVVEKSFDETLVSLTGGASIEERDTWTIKENAARAYIAGDASDIQTAMLTMEAEATGEEVDDLAATIVANADKYYQMVGLAAGMKRAAITTIRACKSLEELDATMTALNEKREATIAGFLNA